MKNILVLLATLGVSAFAGCVDKQKIEGSECPCPKGYVCCETRHVCIADIDPCRTIASKDSGLYNDANDAAIEDVVETDGETADADESDSAADSGTTRCGDGVQDVTEECDDGNMDETDGCTSSCMYTCVSGDTTRDCVTDDKCPTDCPDDSNPCTKDELSGTAANCNAVCTHVPITALIDGDWCCPFGADANTDSDCVAMAYSKQVKSAKGFGLPGAQNLY